MKSERMFSKIFLSEFPSANFFLLFQMAWRKWKNEGELVMQLRHPHIVQLVGVGDHKNLPLLVFEYLEGGSLNHYIHEVIRSRLDHGTFVSVARDVALALNYLHKQPRPILHLDLKSANVLLDAYLRAKLADLGLALRMSPTADSIETDFQPILDPYNQDLELSGPRGTPAWMAPEMLIGVSNPDQKIFISPATDIYGLGVILWEMKSAEKPYAQRSLEEVCLTVYPNGRRIEDKNGLKVPNDLSEDVKLLITQCWHTEPRLRPTCDEVLARLNQMSFPDHWKALFGASPLMDTPVSDHDPPPEDDDLEPRPLIRSVSAPAAQPLQSVIPAPPPPPPPPQSFGIPAPLKISPKKPLLSNPPTGFSVTNLELQKQLSRLKKVGDKNEEAENGNKGQDLALILKNVIVQRRDTAGWCESSSNASSGRGSQCSQKYERNATLSWSGDEY